MRGGETNGPIPLLDLSRFDAGEAKRAAFLADLRAAAHDVGFFYVTGHGVDPRLLHALMESARRLFSLPDGAKLGIVMVNSPHFPGYNRVAFQQTLRPPVLLTPIDLAAQLAA